MVSCKKTRIALTWKEQIAKRKAKRVEEVGVKTKEIKYEKWEEMMRIKK